MKDTNKAALLMVIAALVYAVISALVKGLDGIPVSEKMFFRNLFGLIMVIVIVWREKPDIKGNNRFALIGRGVTGFISTFLFYAALSYAPIAEAMTLSNTYPFLLAILCWVFLGERIRGFHILALVLSFIGAVVIIRPGFAEINIYYIVAVLSAAAMAVTYTFLRKARMTEDTQVIVLWYSAIISLMCIPAMIFQGFVLPSLFQLLRLLLLGIMGTVYQLLLSHAYRFAPATEVSIYSYTTLIFSALLGLIVWGEVPGIFTIFGVALIILGAYVIFRGENARPRKTQ